LDTARIYLNFLGSSRYQLLHNFGVFSATQDRAAIMAAESLGMNEKEYELVTNLYFSGQPVPNYPLPVYELYGYSAATSALSNVQQFLNQTGITFDDLVSLLETQYLNPGQTILLQFQGNNCDVTSAQIVGPLPHLPPPREGPAESPPAPPPPPVVRVPTQSVLMEFFANVPAFLRLWKKLGWTIAELDKAITGVNSLAQVPSPSGSSSETGRSFVLAAAQMKQLQGSLNLTVAQLLSLWADIDVDGRDSLYVQLFPNKTVINPLDRAFQLTYQASLAALPPSPVGTQPTYVSYDPTHQVLEFSGTMTDQQQIDFLTWANGDPPTVLAIQNLFNQRWISGTDVAPDLQSQPNICAHINTILAALQVSAADLSAIAADCGLIPPGADLSALAWAVIGGTVTVGNSITLTMESRSHSFLISESVSYTVAPGDTLNSIAVGVAAKINAHAALTAAGVSAIAQDALINLYVPLVPGTLIAWSSPPAPPAETESVTITTCPPLNIAHLSALYRYAVLAQALNLSVPNMISLKTLTGINPFIPAATDPVTNNTFQFVQAAQTVAASKFSVAQLNYLYRAIPDTADSLPPLQATEDQLAVNLLAGLQKIAAANAYTPDPSATSLRKKLAILLPANQVDPTMNLINGSAVYTSTTSLASRHLCT
jgi:hypothetical protein